MNNCMSTKVDNLDEMLKATKCFWEKFGYEVELRKKGQ